MESADELSAEAEKLSFLNEVLCFFGVDIFSFSQGKPADQRSTKNVSKIL